MCLILLKIFLLNFKLNYKIILVKNHIYKLKDNQRLLKIVEKHFKKFLKKMKGF